MVFRNIFYVHEILLEIAPRGNKSARSWNFFNEEMITGSGLSNFTVTGETNRMVTFFVSGETVKLPCSNIRF